MKSQTIEMGGEKWEVRNLKSQSRSETTRITTRIYANARENYVFSFRVVSLGIRVLSRLSP